MKCIVLKKKKKPTYYSALENSLKHQRKTKTFSDIIKTEVALSQQIRPQRKNKTGLQIKR